MTLLLTPQYFYNVNITCFHCVRHSKMDLRSKIPFLEETPLENLMGAKLPTKRDIFRHFWHKKKNGLKEKDAVRETAKAVLRFWANAGLLGKKIDNVIKDINNWLNAYKVCNFG